ncbi:MAG: OB-fold domain-containing protein [Proteobacteria bacterium]|nr:OB-fold domain-containing protein [Pseudomonadota bacterium]
MEDVKKKELLSVYSGEAEQPFEWSAGKYVSRFLVEMRDNKRLVGCKCPKCKKVLVPPRRVCGECFVQMDEIVTLSGEGSLYSFTVLNFGFVDPDTGIQRPVPYTCANIALDGTDCTWAHYLEETDPAKIKIGMRLRPVWEENRRGHLLDIKHFVPVEGK